MVETSKVPKNMENLRPLVKVVLENFGPVLIFYAVDRIDGLKSAIAASITFKIVEIIYKIRKKEKLPSLFKFSAIMTLVLGAIDLC